MESERITGDDQSPFILNKKKARLILLCCAFSSIHFYTFFTKELLFSLEIPVSSYTIMGFLFKKQPFLSGS